MPVETLKVVLTGDNKGALAAFKEVKNNADGLRESIKKYQDLAFAEKDLAKLGAYNKKIQELQVQLKQTLNAGKIGFDEMGVSIAKTQAPLGKAFSGVRQLAYLLPGIGIAGLFNAAFEGISMLATGFDNAKKSAREFADEYVKAMSGADASSQKEIATIQSLINVAVNEKNSRTDRIRALQQLNKEYPGYFTNISKDISDTDRLREITNKLSEAIIRKGNAEALASLIGKENAKIWEATHQNIDQQIDKVSTATKIWDYFKGSLSSGNPALAAMNSQFNILASSFKQKGETIKLATENIKGLTEELNKNTLEQVKNNDFVDLGTKKVNERVKKLKEYQQLVGSIREVILSVRSKETEKEMKSDAPKHINDSSKLGSGIFNADFDKMATKRKEDLDAYNESLRQTVMYSDMLGDAFSKAIESGQNLGEVLKGVFIDLAKQIQRALIKALLFKAIGSALGVGGIGSLGDVFKSILGGGRGYASGGLATGASSGHLELLHGTEWVLRPEQLSGALNAARTAGSISAMNGGARVSGNTGSQSVSVEMQAIPLLKNGDFWLMFQQAQTKNNRTY